MKSTLHVLGRVIAVGITALFMALVYLLVITRGQFL